MNIDQSETTADPTAEQKNKQPIKRPDICQTLDIFRWVSYFVATVAMFVVPHLFKACKYSTTSCTSEADFQITLFGIYMGVGYFLLLILFGALLNGFSHIIEYLNEIKINSRTRN